MANRLAWVGGVGLGLLIGWQLAKAFIEELTPLQEFIDDADYIFVAKVASLDPTKPATVLTVEQDLKGKAPFRRMPINLTGDSEKHTPQLLKRLAPDLTLVVFVMQHEQQHLVLAYTNGTWFQVIGYPGDKDIRWAFTHCEIYLRRTFKGTTAELLQVLKDVLQHGKKPPPPHPKEPPGLGPEVETKPKDKNAKQGLHGLPSRGGLLFAVITLPFLAPVAALLQLLFPGILREQWRQYRIAVYILLTQSTLIFLHWALQEPRLFGVQPTWWLGPDMLWASLVTVALLGAVVASIRQLRQAKASEPIISKRPVRVEYFALGILALAGLGWGAYLYSNGDSPLDPMMIVTVAALAGMFHLMYRKVCASKVPPRRAWLSTELVFLWGLVLAGTGLGMYLYQPTDNQTASQVVAEWPMFRGNAQRTGSVDPTDPGPKSSPPKVLWQFVPKERRGRVCFYSSPTVVDNQVYVGAQFKEFTLLEGRVYCIDAANGQPVQEKPIWQFRAAQTGFTLRPVFSSPSVANGRIYIGEGYHQDKNCRLFCLDARSADRVLWVKPTGSHVESSPCIVGNYVYFGAGDDGILCVDTDNLETPGTTDELPRPQTVWQYRGIHVDASPLVVGNRLFAGSVVGDAYRDLCAVAVDAETGTELWRVPAPLPLPGSPAHADGRVFFGLGNGKMNQDAENPAGGIWCLDAATGQRLWEFGVSNQTEVGNSVLGSPALMGDKVYFCSRDGHCYGLRQDNGKLIWKVNLGSPLVASPVVASGKVYVVTTTGTVACLHADTGSQLWRLGPEQLDEVLAENSVDNVYASPTLAHSRLYLCVGGKLYCLGDNE